jgi:hypothetical protein
MKQTLLACTVAVLLAGCETGSILPTKGNPATHVENIPPPINLLLPKTLTIHPFTQTEAFSDTTGGVHARIQARDSFGDSTKAFGTVRFELYQFLEQNQRRHGPRVGQWEISIAQPRANLTHWNRHFRSYEFKLACDKPLPTGRRFVLVATFTSPFTPRLSAQREIVAGE